MKKNIKKITICAVSAALVLSMTGCASVQHGFNTIDTSVNGRERIVTVYGIDGEQIAVFDCRCTISYENGRVLFDNLDTNERTAIYGQCATVIAVDKSQS